MLQPVVPPSASGSEPEIRAELERILRSRTFVHSHRIRRFLQFVVEESLQGRQHRLKEYVIGMEVFGRQESFDPRVDSIVRVEARRLRSKLEDYYSNDADSANGSSLRIQIHKGSYVPLFETSSAGQRNAGATAWQTRRSKNPESFTAYLQGLRDWGSSRADAFSSSVAHFSRAVELDPECAAAWAALAEALVGGAVVEGFGGAETSARASHAARKALELSDAVPDSHMAMGLVQSFLDWKWTEGAREMEAALYLDPADAIGRLLFGVQLACRGLTDRARAGLDEAERLDPVSLSVHFAQGWIATLENRHDDAERRYHLVAQLEPDSLWAWFGLGQSCAAQERWPEAIAHFMNASRVAGNRSFLNGCLGYCYARSGRTDDAMALLATMHDAGAPAVSCAAIQAGLGEFGRAFASLQQAAMAKDSSLPLLVLGPEFKAMRGERSFTALQAVMGLAAPVASAA